jgi:hypothetical protein
MKINEKKNVDKGSDETNIKAKKNIQFGERFILVFNEHKGKIIIIGNVTLFIISILIGSNPSKNIPFLLQIRTIIIISLVIFICLSPVLILSTLKCLRRFIVDEEIEEKNIELSEELHKLASNLNMSTEKLEKSINQNEHYFEKVITPHIDDCSKVDNLVKKSYMINDIDMYYEKLIEARQKVNNKNVYLTSFSTMPYNDDNENRNRYYSTDFEFIKHISCKVFRIVTVHSSEKLLFLRELFEDAIKSGSLKYHLAYLNIEEFSDKTGDILPGIVGMDIIGNEVIIMDFRYARALRKNKGFENPLYIESEEIAFFCRNYYEKIWDDISDETPVFKRRYQGYVLYNGAARKKVHDDMDNIWKKIESNIPVKI